MHIKDYLALLVILLVVATAFFFNVLTRIFFICRSEQSKLVSSIQPTTALSVETTTVT